MCINISEKENGITFDCHVTPRAKKNSIKGVRDGALAIALKAPPIEGRANEELVEFLAEIFSIPRTRISIIRGEHGRKKSVRVEGIGKNAILASIGFYL